MKQIRLHILLFLAVFLIQSVFFTPPVQVEAFQQYPVILLRTQKKQLQIGETYRLDTLNSAFVVPGFKSSDRKIATVDSYGVIRAVKQGSVRITVKARKTEAVCQITVLKTKVIPDKTSLILKKGAFYQLKVSVSTGSIPTYTSSKSSVAEVDENGLVRAKKAGETVISIRADKTTVRCTVTVKPPKIKLEKNELRMKVGESRQIRYTSSTGNLPTFTSGRSSAVLVSEEGVITAYKKGNVVVTLREDGVKASCMVIVTEK